MNANGNISNINFSDLRLTNSNLSALVNSYRTSSDRSMQSLIDDGLLNPKAIGISSAEEIVSILDNKAHKILQGAPVILGPSNGPNASSSSISINENVLNVHTFQSNKDVDWSITGGPDASKFNINRNTGALSFKFAPDYENPNSSKNSNS